jgi:hypothetical protein
MRYSFAFLVLFFLACDLFGNSSAVVEDSVQKRSDSLGVGKECPQKDVFDVIFKRRSTKPPSDKKVTSLVVPYVSYSPVTSFQVGVGGSISWRLGNPLTTNLSAATVSANVTTKRQLIVQLKSNVFLKENKWFLQGDWRYYIFSLNTYALGTENGYGVPDIPDVTPGPTAEETTVYPMKFNWLKFHQLVSIKVRKGFYAGMGFHLDYHYNIQDLALKLDTPNVIVTPHYAYSELHGFKTHHYTASGLSLNGVYDSRNNILNPYKGIFVHINYRANFKWMGSNENGSQLWTEFRTYVGLSKRMPRHLLAFWLYGSFHLTGSIPYLDLATIGFDQMNSSGRGYIQGRWRGENMVYGEVEYRFPISMCSKILGGVMFVNATTASNQDLNINLFEAIKPAAGFGIRVMVSKRNLINLQIDVAWGLKSDGFYINAQEAF